MNTKSVRKNPQKNQAKKVHLKFSNKKLVKSEKKKLKILFRISQCGVNCTEWTAKRRYLNYLTSNGIKIPFIVSLKFNPN